MKHIPEQEIQSNIHAYATLCDLAKHSKSKKLMSVPVKTIMQMLDEYEDLLDIIAFDEAKKNNDEYLPKELVDCLIEGENALRVYREYRGLTQQALANKSGVSRDMIAMIETGKKNGSLATAKKLANILEIGIEDIISR